MIIILCIGCKKREADIAQNYNLNPISSSTDTVVSQFKQDVVNSTTENEMKTVQEIIINYPATLPENKFYPITYEFQIEGNFTASGNKEILAFYRELGVSPGLHFFYCFVFDASGETIEFVYPLIWGTSLLTEKDEREAGLTEVLGRPIIWRDRIIGYVGDFNNNGKEELYMYAIYGLGSWPEIFEFDDEKGFIKLLFIEPGPKFVSIIDIDDKKKILTLKIQETWERLDFQLSEEINSYIWDEATQQYEVLSSETKYFRWNRSLQKYEEIEAKLDDI
jgi:hypothetical protein